MKDSMESYTFKGRTWKDLPVDLSLSQLVDKLGCSPNRVRTALLSLGEKEHGGANRIHYDVFYGRRCLDYDKYVQSKGGFPGVDTNTIPVSIYWETEELLSQIVEVSKESRYKREPHIANRVLQLLANVVSKKGKASAIEDYRSVRLLQNSAIQKQMVESYFGELDRRLTLLRQILISSPAKLSVKFLRATIQKTDALLVDFLAALSSKLSEELAAELPETCDPREVLFQLYDELLSIRRSCLVSNGKAGTRGNPTYNFLPTTEKSCADDLRDILQSTDWKQKSEQARVLIHEKMPELNVAYNRYILSCIESEKFAVAEDFADDYFELKMFIEAETPVGEKTFLEYVEDKLFDFVRNQFDELRSLDILPYRIEDLTARRMSESVANELIQNAQQQILVTLHNSFYLLRIAYTLKYFSMETLVPNSSTTKMKEFHNNLHAEIDRLAKELPELPLLSVDPAKRCDIKSFCEIYAQVVPPILKCKPYLEEDIAKNILITQLDSVDWISASRLLTMQCELVACQKAKEAASEVVSRQRKLIEQLKNVD